MLRRGNADREVLRRESAEREVLRRGSAKGSGGVLVLPHALCVPPGHRADPSGRATTARCPLGGKCWRGVCKKGSAEVKVSTGALTRALRAPRAPRGSKWLRQFRAVPFKKKGARGQCGRGYCKWVCKVSCRGFLPPNETPRPLSHFKRHQKTPQMTPQMSENNLR